MNEELIKTFCLFTVIGIGIGYGIILLFKIWERAFDEILQMFNLKKEFTDFVFNKYHKQTRVVSVDGPKCFSKEDQEKYYPDE